MKLYLIIFSLIFLTLLVFPIFGWGVGQNQITHDENRTLAGKPTLPIANWKNFAKEYNDYFDDNFSFRPDLITAINLIKYKIFATSPSPSVSLGKNNWLFYTPEDTFIDTLNAHPFSDSELEQIKQNLEKTNRYLASQNIHFYFLVAPNSQTIYPEYLPDYLEKLSNTSRLDQITNYLAKNHAKVVFINPTTDLLAAKKDGKLYFKYDTHWNELGAFIGYQSLFQKISMDFPTLQPKTLVDFKLTYSPSPHDDLAELIGLTGFLNESSPQLLPNDNLSSQIFDSDCPNQFTSCPVLNYIMNSSSNLTLVDYRDSFGTNLIPFINQHFQKTFYIWKEKPLSLETVQKEKPQIVIFELTERELWRLTDPIFILPANF